jgi:hypothetical protein
MENKTLPGRGIFPKDWQKRLARAWCAAALEDVRKGISGSHRQKIPKGYVNGESPAMHRMGLIREVKEKRSQLRVLQNNGDDWREVHADLEKLERKISEVEGGEK